MKKHKEYDKPGWGKLTWRFLGQAGAYTFGGGLIQDAASASVKGVKAATKRVRSLTGDYVEEINHGDYVTMPYYPHDEETRTLVFKFSEASRNESGINELLDPYTLSAYFEGLEKHELRLASQEAVEGLSNKRAIDVYPVGSYIVLQNEKSPAPRVYRVHVHNVDSISATRLIDNRHLVIRKAIEVRPARDEELPLELRSNQSRVKAEYDLKTLIGEMDERLQGALGHARSLKDVKMMLTMLKRATANDMSSVTSDRVERIREKLAGQQEGLLSDLKGLVECMEELSDALGLSEDNEPETPSPQSPPETSL